MNPPPDAPMLPPNLPPLPPLLVGYDRWEYRGRNFRCQELGRVFSYTFPADGREGWSTAKEQILSGSPELHYIEAVKDSPRSPNHQPVQDREPLPVKDTPAVPAQGGEKSQLDAILDNGSVWTQPPAPDSLRQTPRTDIAAWTTGVSTEWRAVVDADFARTLERELAEKEVALSRLQIELGSVRLVARSYYDALGKESEKLTAAKQDSERLEWLMKSVEWGISREGRYGWEYLTTREEIDAARREEGV